MQLSAASLTGQSEWCDELISWTRDVRNYFRHHARCHAGCDNHLILWSGVLERGLLQIFRNFFLSNAHCISKPSFVSCTKRRFRKHGFFMRVCFFTRSNTKQASKTQGPVQHAVHACNKFALRQSGPLLTPVTDKLIFPSTAEFSKRDAGPLSLTCSEN